MEVDYCKKCMDEGMFYATHAFEQCFDYAFQCTCKAGFKYRNFPLWGAQYKAHIPKWDSSHPALKLKDKSIKEVRDYIKAVMIRGKFDDEVFQCYLNFYGRVKTMELWEQYDNGGMFPTHIVYALPSTSSLPTLQTSS